MASTANDELWTQVTFRFCISEVSIGEQVRVVGNVPALGEWNIAEGIALQAIRPPGDALTTHPNLLWFSSESIPFVSREKLEYRYAICDEHGNFKRHDSSVVRTLDPMGLQMTVEDDNGLYRKLAGNFLPTSFRGVTEKLDSICRPVVPLDSADRVVVVGLNLPVRIVRGRDGLETRTQSSSIALSLRTSMFRIKDSLPHRIKFVGYPGVMPRNDAERKEIVALLEPFNCAPVFITEESSWDYFSNFCSLYLSGLLHSEMQLDEAILSQRNSSGITHDSASWIYYKQVVKLYAQATLDHTREKDILWVQDYHLIMLPKYLRQSRPNAMLSYWLDTPFPDAALFRYLPMRADVLEAMLKANLIGFHLFEYARQFLASITELLDTKHYFQKGGLLMVEHKTKIGNVHKVVLRCSHQCLPSIELKEHWRSPGILKAAEDCRQKYEGKIIILGMVEVDRFNFGNQRHSCFFSCSG
jgi:hypothetical protein